MCVDGLELDRFPSLCDRFKAQKHDVWHQSS
jgi:hypothetical protein